MDVDPRTLSGNNYRHWVNCVAEAVLLGMHLDGPTPATPVEEPAPEPVKAEKKTSKKAASKSADSDVVDV